MTVSNWLEQHRQENPRWYEPAAVYRLWDADGNLLYIGSAFNPDHRCKSHQKKPWWSEVARRTEEWHPSRGAAYAEELKAIAVERSKYNDMGTPGYRTPQTEKIKQRNALARTRSLLISEGYSVKAAIREAAREAGYSHDEADRMATLAEIEFLEHTGLFAASVKRRREMLARAGRA
ncbi:GIY-YIG nuclease family protein [Streptomyces sp. NPDC020298]|uniref:GIY-YIG nuclease family protein n=1 Tax=unclassified Streptomyces TaxID=2593676 RepID=UPI00340D8A55